MLHNAKTWRMLGICSAIILFQALVLCTFSTSVNAAQPVIQVTGPGTSVAPAGAIDVEPTRPFAGGNENKAAHTVITDESMSAPYLDVVNYALSVAEKTPGETLILNCLLSKQEDRATLDRLADKIYNDNNLSRYNRVLINWHLGGNPTNDAPWAQTAMTKAGTGYGVNFVVHPVRTN